MGAPVVYDINVLVDAAPAKGGDPLIWPSLPPRTAAPARDSIGAINDRRDFTLWLSPHILTNLRRVLIGAKAYEPAEADQYVDVITQIAIGSGGGVVDPPRTVHVNEDYEDNLILDLAADVGAVMIVSSDKHLVDMPLWRGTPVLRPREFAARADAAWRNRPRHDEPSTTDLIRRRMEKDAAERASTRRADEILDGSTPDGYRRLREGFETNRERLAGVVDGWRDQGPKMKPRIELWEKNLDTIARRVAEVDAIAQSSPQIAHDALTTLSAKVDIALERLVPARQTQPLPSNPAPRRASVPAFDDSTVHRTGDRQFGS